jgi:type II secretory pathway pseudopilin PulG
MIFYSLLSTRKRRVHAAGFTYLWLLIAIALMGVGLALASEAHVTASQRDKERELIAVGRQFRAAIASYYETRSNLRNAIQTASPATYGSTASGRDFSPYPASLNDLIQDPNSPGIKRHLRKVFVDPMTGRAEWGLIYRDGRLVGVHSLSGIQPVKQRGFDPDNAAFEGAARYSDWVFVYPIDLNLQ